DRGRQPRAARRALVLRRSRRPRRHRSDRHERRRPAGPAARPCVAPHNGLMNAIKLAGIGLVALIVAVGLGFAWGASGRTAAQDALDGLQQQLDVAQARGAILGARVSLYNVNFGEAQRQLEEAKAPLGRARERAQKDRKTSAADGFATA